ncbi:MAG: hypothetical protein FWC46_07610 [Actinomycetia bacterium]|nr:hypothetical protein [Actinomycetes bacterium]
METLLVSADASLTDLVQASAAATGATVRVCPDPRAARPWWLAAPTVLVGADCAPQTASLGLPRRLGVHVIGQDAAQVLTWSTPLQAAGLVLPGQAGLLTGLLDPAANDRETGRARLIQVAGATGGLGTSTVAAGLAVRAARRGLATCLVELDRFGGGLDLLFGAEDEPGWRWGDLASARGHLAELRGHLPSVCGVEMIAVGRGAAAVRPTPEREDAPAGGFADDEAIRAVLAAARRSFDVVVIDQGLLTEHDAASGAARVPSGTAPTILVVGADVRAVFAAQARLAWADPTAIRLVVRTGPGRRLDPGLVASTLKASLLGVFPHDGALPGQADVGDPPGRARGATSRRLDHLLDATLALAPAAPGPVVSDGLRRAAPPFRRQGRARG